MPLPGGASALYVHVPFCLRKCPYCAFYSVPFEGSAADRYLDGLEAELVAEAEPVRETTGPPGPDGGTVYIGGGTPSVLGPDRLGRLLDLAIGALPSGQVSEVTVEVNPCSVTAGLLERLKGHGATRVSIGVQSLSDPVLRALGRPHTAAAGLAAVEAALASGLAVSADLIVGLASFDWRACLDDLDRLAALGAGHLSVYGLMVEPGTPFASLDPSPLAGDDEAADGLVAVWDRLESLGFRHYEIASFARPGAESRHNQVYWRLEPYLGVGPAAASLLRLGGRLVRRENAPDLARWLDDPAGSRQQHGLDPETALAELLMTGLRTARGVKLSETGPRCGLEPGRTRLEAIGRLARSGLIRDDGGTIRPTRRGWLLFNAWIVDLI